MRAALHPFAVILGRAMAGYAVATARPSRARIEGMHQLPSRPAIYLGWHGANLLAMGLLRAFGPRTCCSIIPSGLPGTTIRSFLHGIGSVEPVALDERETGSLRAALRHLEVALQDGKDVVIAGDGPAGPAFQLRPGAVWLARMTGSPLVPIGYAASPAFRVPRWDRHIVPFPGARVAAVVGAQTFVTRRQSVNKLMLSSIESQLNEVTDRAWEIVRPQALPV